MLELVAETDVTVEHYPQVKPSSVAAVVYDTDGSALETLIVTTDSASTTIATATSATQWTLTDATGFAAGRRYWWAGARGGGGPVLISELTGNDIVIDSAPPGVVRATDALTGLRCTAPVEGDNLDTRGRGYRIDWLTTDADGLVHPWRDEVWVVRQRFATPTTAAIARTFVAARYPEEAQDDVDPARWVELSRRANLLVNEEARSQHRYPHLTGDSGMWRKAGEIALKIELADEGIVPAGWEPDSYWDRVNDDLATEIDRIFARSWNDVDDDGAYSEDTETASMSTTRGIRR